MLNKVYSLEFGVPYHCTGRVFTVSGDWEFSGLSFTDGSLFHFLDADRGRFVSVPFVDAHVSSARAFPE